MSDTGAIATSVRLRVRPLRATSATARSLKLNDGKCVNFRTAEGADSTFAFDAVYGALLHMRAAGSALISGCPVI